MPGKSVRPIRVRKACLLAIQMRVTRKGYEQAPEFFVRSRLASVGQKRALPVSDPTHSRL